MKATPDQKPFAVITGLESMQGLQAARILATRHRLPVIAVTADKTHPYRLTNCCNRVVCTDNNLINDLEDIGRELPNKAVLFPGTDRDVLLVSQARDRLSKLYHLCLPEPDTVELLMDKRRFYTFAKKSGFPIPATHFIYNRHDLEAAASRIALPCVLKPHIRDAAWNRLSVFKAFKINTIDQLMTVYEQYKSGTDCFILQDWIEGPDANLYSCNAYFNAQSEPLVTFVARKLRQWPPEMGQSALGEECRDDFVLQETVRMFQRVAFQGLAYLEFKQDQHSGKYFMVEPNICRPTGRSAIAEAGGVDLLFTMYCDALGWPLPINRKQQYKGVKWINLRQDLRAALYYRRRGELTVRQWWSSIRGKKTFAIFSWRDQRPFWGDLWRCARLFIDKGERRKRNPERSLG